MLPRAVYASVYCCKSCLHWLLWNLHYQFKSQNTSITANLDCVWQHNFNGRKERTEKCWFSDCFHLVEEPVLLCASIETRQAIDRKKKRGKCKSLWFDLFFETFYLPHNLLGLSFIFQPSLFMIFFSAISLFEIEYWHFFRSLLQIYLYSFASFFKCRPNVDKFVLNSNFNSSFAIWDDIFECCLQYSWREAYFNVVFPSK